MKFINDERRLRMGAKLFNDIARAAEGPSPLHHFKLGGCFDKWLGIKTSSAGYRWGDKLDFSQLDSSISFSGVKSPYNTDVCGGSMSCSLSDKSALSFLWDRVVNFVSSL